jgi:hypothetical protein
MKTNAVIFLAIALVLASLTGIAAGQSPDLSPTQAPTLVTKGGQHFSPQTYVCAYNFSAGIGYNFISFCITANGNVLQIATPDGRPQIADGYEGYGICNETPAQAYDDWGPWGNSGNWGAVSVLSQNATSVKMARTTADGIWTLTQTFTIVPSTPSAKIVMALKNNTSAARVAYLVRYGDIDADYRNYGNLLNNFSATTSSALAWNSSVPFGSNNGYGLQLQNLGAPQFGYMQGFARTTFEPPNPCDFAGDSSPLITGVDGSVALAYVDTIGAHKTKTATMVYRGF